MQKTKVYVSLVHFSDFGLVRGLYIAEALCLLGLKVTIITNKPVYSSSQRYQVSSPLNFSIKVIDFKIPFVRSLYSSIFGRLIVYIVFTVLSFVKMLGVTPEPKLLYSGLQPFTNVSCIFYKWFRRSAKIVSEIRDLWPDTLEYVDLNNVLKHILIAIGHSVNHWVFSKTDAIITLNEVMRKVLQNRVKQKMYIIYGPLDLEKFKPMAKEDALRALPREIYNIADRKFVVLYSGIMGTFQDPLVIVDIAEKIQNEYRDIIFIAIGSGPLKHDLQKRVQEKSLSNVIILNAVSHELMPFIYNIADLTLLPPPVLSNPKMYKYFSVTLTRKFMEYASCGKPILCVTPPCVASKLCVEWNAGYHIYPYEVEKAVHIIQTLKENESLRNSLGNNARRMSETLFSLEVVRTILEKLLKDLGFKS